MERLAVEEGSDDEEVDLEEDVPGTSPTDSAGRPLSSPVLIPSVPGGDGGGPHRNTQRRRRVGLRSSGDIKALQALHHQKEKPLSAPAVSHMQPAATTITAAAASDAAVVPEDTGVILASPSEGKVAAQDSFGNVSLPSTDSAVSSSAAGTMYAYPPSSSLSSCSPDFPFAFTPREHHYHSPSGTSSLSAFGTRYGRSSLSSPGLSPREMSVQHAMQTAAKQPSSTTTAGPGPGPGPGPFPGSDSSGPFSGGGALVVAASPPPPPSPVLGRETTGPSSSTALVRRSSWGARSSSVGEGSTIAIGYSVSPIHHELLNTGLDSLLYSTSTPRNQGGSGGGNTHSAGVGVLGFPSPASVPSGPPGGGTGQGGVVLAGALGITPDASLLRREKTNPPLLTWERPTPQVTGFGDDLPFDFAEDLDASRIRCEAGEPSEDGCENISSSEAGYQSQSEVVSLRKNAMQEENGGRGNLDGGSVAALGAFVKLLHETKPLTGLEPIDLLQGMAQLDRVSASLAARGVS